MTHKIKIFTNYVESKYLIALDIQLLLENKTLNESCGVNRNVWSSLMIGLPNQATIEEFEAFVAPYLPEISNYVIITQKEKHHDSYLSLTDKLSIIDFNTEYSRQGFSNIYNNLHFPFQKSAPPCLVIPIETIEIIDGHKLSSDEQKSTENESEYLSSLLPEVQENELLLPICCECLRRILVSVSKIDGANDIPMRSYYGDSSRCKVCFVYAAEAEAASALLRGCRSCGVSDNIWMCLQCGHTGCGRYTAQHAQQHYSVSKHPFSLELATGRVWQYGIEDFVQPALRSHPVQRSASDASAQDAALQCGKDRSRGSEAPSGTDGGAQDKAEACDSFERTLQQRIGTEQRFQEKNLSTQTARFMEASLLQALLPQHASPAGVLVREDELQAVEAELRALSLLEMRLAESVQRLDSQRRRRDQLRRLNDRLASEVAALEQAATASEQATAALRESGAARVAELEQQMRDLSFFNRAQQQLQGHEAAELQGGSVVLPRADPLSQPRRGKKKTAKKN